MTAENDTMCTPYHALLLDDEPYMLDIYSLQCLAEGNKVTPCTSVDEAVKKLRTGLKPDVIVSDILMPVMDGYDFLRIVRDEHLAESVPIVMLTNQSDASDFEKTKELGATAHYVKFRSMPKEIIGLVSGVVEHVRSGGKRPVPVQ